MNLYANILWMNFKILKPLTSYDSYKIVYSLKLNLKFYKQCNYIYWLF